MKDDFGNYKRHSDFAKVIWYNPAYKLKCGRIVGKGYGAVELKDGSRAFLYGQELGGGMFGEDPKIQPKPNDLIYVKTVYINDSDKTHSMFMGLDYRVKSVDLKRNKNEKS